MPSSASYLATLLAILPAAAAAQGDRAKPVPPTTTGAVVVTGQATNDPNRMICRTSNTTGSRLGRSKVCRTASQWSEINAADRQDIERMQANRSKNN